MRPTCYLDASALVKLVVLEPESDAFRTFVAGRHLTATEITEVEAHRAVQRRAPLREQALVEALAAVSLIPLDDDIRRLASTVEPARLRSLDAIHLATALLVEGIDEFVSYDSRLTEAARDRGLNVLSPA